MGRTMILPPDVLHCLTALERAGYAAYAVGGCVRDSLLGLTPHDYDLCTAAAPSQTAAVFSAFPLVRAGEKHGTIGVVTERGVVEITTFRTDGLYRDGRHPEGVSFVADVEADLARRDFTVNAMAYSPSRGLIDPYGGEADLRAGILRAVGDPAVRFCEDALRILRAMRFSVRFGLTVEPETARAMLEKRGMLAQLSQERVYAELCGFLPFADDAAVLRFAPLLCAVLPELLPEIGFDQKNPHHAYDLFTHTAKVVAAVPPELSLRWAALLHDVGKPAVFYLDEAGHGHFPGHAQVGKEIADAALLRLRAPNALRERVTTLIGAHMTELVPDRKILRRRLGKYGFDTLRALLALQRADFSAKGVPGCERDPTEKTRALLDELERENACVSLHSLAVSGHDLLALGFAPGKRLGACLAMLLARVQDETLPNERAALLSAARDYGNAKEDTK